MNSPSDEAELLQRSRDGDAGALQQLLWLHYDRLLASIRGQVPADLRAVVDGEDVLQETFVDACRGIRNFDPRSDNSFSGWLTTLARHNLLDRIKAEQAQKRGGRKRVPAEAKGQESSALVPLIDLIDWDSLSPSRVAARNEAERAVRIALAGLPDDYRQALTLRYLEARPVADVARQMHKTDRAVHMLCHRGLKKLHEALGRSSDFLSSKT